jgi:hypothetical protein
MPVKEASQVTEVMERANTEGAYGDIEEGQVVITGDGHKIGKVKEITPSHFMVDQGLWRHAWLGRENILVADGDRVVLTFDKDDLDAYKLSRPESGTPVTDGLLSDEQMEEQRRRMEAEVIGAHRRN